MLLTSMSFLKSLSDIFATENTDQELYTSDQKRRKWRANKGRYTRSEGVFSFIHLIKNWEEIVGKMMAQNTIPLKIKASTLYISTKHAVFAQELAFLAPEILEKVKASFPELENKITKIKFIHSDFSAHAFEQSKKAGKPVKQKEKLHPLSPEFQQRKIKAQKLVADIEDEEIKEILTKFMLEQ